MSPLFEYGQWQKASNKDDLKSFLCTIWGRRIAEREEVDLLEGMDNRYQPFLQFDDDMIRANNYVGFIQNGNQLIEIYPKVFRSVPEADKALMLRHIFHWLGYCRKWKFPFTQSSLERHDIDNFPELIIHLIATKILDTVSQGPLMQYQMHQESLMTPRGSINFTRQVHHGYSKGNFHKLECDYEPFLFDNKVNRIIKYCIQLLLTQTRLSENQKILREISFMLDEVEDVSCTVNDLNSISLNSFYEDYNVVIDLCKAVIEQQIYSSRTYDLSQWCLLFPMEYIFEDFLAGFLQTHFSTTWHVEYQKSNAYLATNPDAFQMQHDIFLTSKDGLKRKIIIDTKYKVRSYLETDRKKGVSQSDLYQVVSYAYRRGCSEIVLIYPNASEQLRKNDFFEVRSGFEDNIIQIKIAEIPFWSLLDFNGIDQALRIELGKILSLQGLVGELTIP